MRDVPLRDLPMREAQVCIARIVGSGICVAAADGHRVHEAIRGHLLDGRRVVISFASVTRVTTAFLNTAIGQLYGEFPEERLRRQLAPPLDAAPRQLVQLKLVVDRAKVFFRDPAGEGLAFADAVDLE